MISAIFTRIIYFFQSREVDRRNSAKVREANYYFFIEGAIALFIAFVINVFVVSVFAHGLYKKTNEEIFSICLENNFTHVDEFPVSQRKNY